MFDVYHYMEVQGQILAQVLISAQAGVSNFIPLYSLLIYTVPRLDGVNVVVSCHLWHLSAV